MSNVLELREIYKSFKQGDAKLDVLSGVDLDLKKGEMVALVGPSGCGKSTLLQIAGLLEAADRGKIIFAGKDMSSASDRKRTKVRRDNLGFVYQYHHLLPDFSALENVIIPQLIAKKKKKDARKKAEEILDRLGLKERLNHRPAELSGGEQQRVAIARALANQPKLMLADEPTGNLDPKTAKQVFSVLLEEVKYHDLSLLMATHNHDLAKSMDHVFSFTKGKLKEGL